MTYFCEFSNADAKKLLSQQMLCSEFHKDADNYNNYVLKFQETSCEVLYKQVNTNTKIRKERQGPGDDCSNL